MAIDNMIDNNFAGHSSRGWIESWIDDPFLLGNLICGVVLPVLVFIPYGVSRYLRVGWFISSAITVTMFLAIKMLEFVAEIAKTYSQAATGLAELLRLLTVFCLVAAACYGVYSFFFG